MVVCRPSPRKTASAHNVTGERGPETSVGAGHELPLVVALIEMP